MNQTINLKLTNQEQKIINYCSNKSEIMWESLAQFAKEPQKVKKNTLQRIISEIKKKYKDCGLQVPFNCIFLDMSKNVEQKEQKFSNELVKLRVTPDGNRVPETNKELDAHLDFKLEPIYKRVRTKSGVANLSPNEWEVFTFLYEKAEKMVSMEELKNIVYKNFGSKTPHCWADSIKRTLTKLRTNIKELKSQNRLVTVLGNGTTYYMLK